MGTEWFLRYYAINKVNRWGIHGHDCGTSLSVLLNVYCQRNMHIGGDLNGFQDFKLFYEVNRVGHASACTLRLPH